MHVFDHREQHLVPDNMLSQPFNGSMRDQLDARGTLDVLRHGVELMGLKGVLKLAEFKPALAVNADILARYQTNRFAAHAPTHQRTGAGGVGSATPCRGHRRQWQSTASSGTHSKACG